jgi:hypothetical protein
VTLSDPLTGSTSIREKCILTELKYVSYERLLRALDDALSVQATRLVYLMPVPIVGGKIPSSPIPVLRSRTVRTSDSRSSLRDRDRGLSPIR